MEMEMENYQNTRK